MKNPIPYTYDLNTKSAQKVICVTHTDDNSVDVIQLHVVQGGALIDFSGNTIIARMVMSRTHELLSDNVVCEIDEATKDVMIPIDRKAVSTRKGLMLIEVNVRGVLPEKLTLQFPLLVRVNGSILDDAEITPESQGTIPELLIAAAEELRRVQGFITSDDVYDILDSTLQGAQNVTPSLYVKRKGDNYALVYEDSNDVLHELFDFSNLPSGASDYTDLQNKPQINSHTLSGDKSSDDLGLQKKLTAGTNITIANGGTISAATGRIGIYGRAGIDTYPIVSDIDWFGLEGQFSVSYDNVYNRYNINIGDCIIKYDPDFPMILNKNRLINAPINTWGLIRGDDSGLRFFMPPNSNGGILLTLSVLDVAPQLRFQIVINNDGELYTRKYLTSDTTVVWKKCGSQLVSAVVNQNGTITFTDSDGNTFTTSGSKLVTSGDEQISMGYDNGGFYFLFDDGQEAS